MSPISRSRHQTVNPPSAPVFPPTFTGTNNTTLENDVDYAFHLQMHEAKKASLASKPPSGSSSTLSSPASCFQYANGMSSSSSSSSSSKVFKVYVKGLVSEERIKDATVSVAAIGVVICDSKGHQIFEMRKPLDDYCGKKVPFSSDEVGIIALIEGLEAAADFSLKRVTCFCDEEAIHRYVMGGYQPPQNVYELVLRDVMLLKKKFVQFSLVLGAPKDMKSAFKLARMAILCQTTWSWKNDPEQILMETCIICFEDTVSGKMFSLDGCLHRFCLSCMKQHADAKFLSGTNLVKCPREGCKTELNTEKFLNPKQIDIMRQRKKEASIPVTEKVYCPYPKCSFLMSKKEVLEYTKTFYKGLRFRPSGARKCMKCLLFFCIHCKAPWHYRMDCRGFKTSKAYRLAGNDHKLESLASQKLWRQCVKCSNMVELAHGCYHIYCRCGHEFCYRCGAAWKDKKATCKCPLWDEPAMIVYNNGPRRRG